jgi:hypothetical protein
MSNVFPLSTSRTDTQLGFGQATGSTMRTRLDNDLEQIQRKAQPRRIGRDLHDQAVEISPAIEIASESAELKLRRSIDEHTSLFIPHTRDSTGISSKRGSAADAPWGAHADDALMAFGRGDIPGIGAVIIAGEVRALRSRNAPAATCQVVVPPEMDDPPGSAHV